MNKLKQETPDQKTKTIKKLTLEDLDQVVGGVAPAELKVKIEVESVPPGTKADGGSEG